MVLSLFTLLPLTMPTMAEQQGLDLTQYRGKVVYLDFWASWCGPCSLSFPYMEGLTHSFSKNDLVVVTVNLDRSRSAAEKFLQKNGSDLPVIYDGEGKIAEAYNVSDMPTSIVIDRTGKVRFTHKGFHSDEQANYTAHINKLVKER